MKNLQIRLKDGTIKIVKRKLEFKNSKATIAISRNIVNDISQIESIWIIK